MAFKSLWYQRGRPVSTFQISIASLVSTCLRRRPDGSCGDKSMHHHRVPPGRSCGLTASELGQGGRPCPSGARDSRCVPIRQIPINCKFD